MPSAIIPLFPSAVIYEATFKKVSFVFFLISFIQVLVIRWTKRWNAANFISQPVLVSRNSRTRDWFVSERTKFCSYCLFKYVLNVGYKNGCVVV